MARRKKDTGGPGSGDWLNTYADMVTLLLTFFILLFSMSSLDAAKFNMLVAAFASDIDSSDKIVIAGEGQGELQTGDINVPEGDPLEVTDLEDIYNILSEYIQEKGLEQSVNVSQGEGYVFIQFMDDMLFEPNSSRLKAADLEILNFVGYGIKSVQNEVSLIRIDGHTAAIPGNPDYAVSDRILSSERANRVLMYFEDEIGIQSEKLVQVAFGKNYPIANNDNEEGRSKNRRVEIIISKDNILSDQLDNIYEQLIE